MKEEVDELKGSPSRAPMMFNSIQVKNYLTMYTK